MDEKARFRPALFAFLRDLKRNNDRDWFQANKARYETDVKAPLLAFIDEFAIPLGKISMSFVADPRPVGGSMFRIYRDTRFSKDKSPYKTHAAVQFRHRRGKDVHAPGFYLHLEPGQVFAGMGMWHPDGPSLAKIRQAIVDEPKAWKRCISGKAFREKLVLGGDSLKRPPRGFDPDHPLIEDLKRKDFICSLEFTEKQACAAGFTGELARSFRAGAPFMRFLTEAVGLEF